MLEGGTESIGNTLTKKAGPAPVWVWGVVGVLALVWYWRRKSSSTSSTAAATGSAGTTGTLPYEVTTNAGGMPFTTSGDTFVNVTNNIPSPVVITPAPKPPPKPKPKPKPKPPVLVRAVIHPPHEPYLVRSVAKIGSTSSAKK